MLKSLQRTAALSLAVVPIIVSLSRAAQAEEFLVLQNYEGKDTDLKPMTLGGRATTPARSAAPSYSGDKPAIARQEPICYMQNNQGQIFDLTSLCGAVRSPISSSIPDNGRCNTPDALSCMDPKFRSRGR